MIGTIVQTVRNADWKAIAARTGATLQLTWAFAQLLTMTLLILSELIYSNRQKIFNAAAHSVAFTVVVTEMVYQAGGKTREWVDRINAQSADFLDSVPEQMAPVAPIVAPTVTVAKSAYSALIDWLGFSMIEEVTPEQRMEELMALPAATLREMAGTRSRYPKAKLVAMIVGA